MESIFVSSVQKELQAERYAVRDFVQGNDLLRQFFRVFLFEDLPPADRRAGDLYLEEVGNCPIFVGLFGNEYGRADQTGLSATEKEFQHASKLRKRRLILIKGRDDKHREARMNVLINRAGDEVVRRRFEDIPELLRLLYGSLIQYLQDRGFVAARDFDAAPCPDATMADISDKKVRQFIEKAREERDYTLAVDTPPEKALAHLNLLARGAPTRGAVLLFGDAPERFLPSAEVTCLHFHGTEIVKPIPTQQVYRGTLFEMVDQAVDFVMARVARAVKPSDSSPQSDVRYEVPYRAVREAVVNAVAHRNYASKSGVQVSVFADRIEVWNPGGLPEDLTADQLRVPHPSVPRNRLICEPLFLAHYIERAGTGTLDMIRLCGAAGLPEPEFRGEGERFVAILWRDWLTESVMASLGLHKWQRQAIAFARMEGRLTNASYLKLSGGSRRSALRMLYSLVQLGILEPRGKGRGAHYVLSKTKRAINAPNAPQARQASKGSQTGQGPEQSTGSPSAKRATNAPNVPHRKRNKKETNRK